jgi:putative SOS response-associated peptidase YedK
MTQWPILIVKELFATYLVVADGFFEWARGDSKTPYYFRLQDGGPFAFAGLWERWVRCDS